MANQPTYNFKKIEKKWQDYWHKNKTHESEPIKNKSKFFANAPYPYVSGFMHIGHLFSYLRADFLARYKKLTGYNILFPFAFHATGSPIQTAANKIKENNELQISILKNNGIPEKEIPKFSDPYYWPKYFIKKFKEDITKVGLHIDWRRSFTTVKNKPYSKFIQWQFRKLKEKNLLTQGDYPIIYCPKDQTPLDDHARSEGEGVDFEEATLIKFETQLNNRKVLLPVVTFRPETIFGVTNIWLNPQIDYILVQVNSQDWLISKQILIDLKSQKLNPKIKQELKGKNLIGLKVQNKATNTTIYSLPAAFIDPSFGTGVVMSVPAHAPFDYIALKDIQNNEVELKKYFNDEQINEIKQIKPITLIKTPGYNSAIPAESIINKYQIKNQQDERLDKISREFYTKEFHEGIFIDTVPEYKNQKVLEAKQKIIQNLTKQNLAQKYFILPDKVVCRCGTRATVKIIDGQWFINYGDKSWKQKVHQCLEQMKIIPDKAIPQFKHTIDWLNIRPCARKQGLGTPLPFDQSWTIESLSDSTIYMSYYILSKYLENPKEYKINIDKIDDSFFDFIFLDKGDIKQISKKTKISEKLINQIKSDFIYWYPFDIRNTAKDLIQNHMTMCLFNHTAIFDKKYWPRGMSINGYVTLGGKKISKSKGGGLTIQQAIRNYSADGIRLACAYASDANLEGAEINLEFAQSVLEKLNQIKAIVLKTKTKSTTDELDIWFETKLAQIRQKYQDAQENMNFRTSIQLVLFDLQNLLKWYQKRTIPNKKAFDKYIQFQLLSLYPFAPHITSDLYQKLYKKDLEKQNLNDLKLEQKNINKIDQQEEALKKTIEDINQIIKIKGSQANKIYLYVIPKDFDFFSKAKPIFNEIAQTTIYENNKATYDPQNKASKAKPLKPGIFIE